MKVVYSSIIKVAMLFMTLGVVACDSKNTNSSDKHNDESICFEEPTTILPFMNERQKQLLHSHLYHLQQSLSQLKNP